ncbi:MAG: hypothetical protein WCO52_05925 [bacterium]
MGSWCSGGGGGSSTQTVNQNNIPDWAVPYATATLDSAAKLTNTTDNPYQAYGGTQVAGFNPQQEQVFKNVQGMKVPGQTQQATGAAGMATANALSPERFSNQVSQYMSPYTQQVINQQQLGAIGDYGRSLPQLGSAAGQAGGLGGTRSALMQSEANRNLQNQLQGITATGYQNAFQNAQNEYNTQQQTALAGAGQLGQLGQQQYGQEMGINQAQGAAGAQQQALAQQIDTSKYQDFLNQQNYPYKQLGFMSDILHGVPSQASAQQFYAPTPNQASGIASLVGQAASGGVPKG